VESRFIICASRVGNAEAIIRQARGDRDEKKPREVCAMGKCEPTNSSRLYLGAEHQNSFSMTGEIRK